MAINERPELRNRHTGYLATTGGGKSQALKQNKALPRRGVRLLAWDPGRDHKNHTTLFEANQWREFMTAALAGVRSGRGFRLGYNGLRADVDRFEAWCKLVWLTLDGNFETHIIMEELAEVQPSPGKAPPMCGVLFNQSRKYNGIIHYTSQSPEEISNTALKQTNTFYIGNPGDLCSDAGAKRLARAARNPGGVSELRELPELAFYRRQGLESKRIQLKYKNL